MNINSIEENKNKIIASTVSIILFSLLLLFFLFYSILSPNDSIAQESGSIEVGFGSSEQTNVNAQSFSSEQSSAQPNTEKVESKSNSATIIPRNDKTSAELLLDKFFENKGKTSGGVTENQSGEKAGDPLESTIKNTKGNNDEGLINANFAINLTGRKIEAQPTLSKDTKEEGKVVVEISVDKLGKVIKANPNGRGTTTSSSVLKEKAKQTALSTKFSVSNIEEQKGTITIIFSF